MAEPTDDRAPAQKSDRSPTRHQRVGELVPANKQADAARPPRRAPRRQPQTAAPSRPIIPERSPAPEYLIVGRIASSYGVHGDLKMAIITNHPEHLAKLKQVYLGDEHTPITVRRIQIRAGEREAIIRFVNLTTPEAAAAYRGQLVWIALADAPPLPTNELYHYQLIGLDVVDTAGNLLGRLAEILETGANDVYVVRGPLGETLFPAIDGVILGVDLEAGVMTVKPLEYY